jgi:hypothetical protein
LIVTAQGFEGSSIFPACAAVVATMESEAIKGAGRKAGE